LRQVNARVVAIEKPASQVKPYHRQLARQPMRSTIRLRYEAAQLHKSSAQAKLQASGQRVCVAELPE